MSKSYKLNKDVVKMFAIACDKAGTTQAKQLTQMMQNFINSVDCKGESKDTPSQ